VLLAAVLWLDGGLRKVRSDSIVMRRTLFGSWHVAEILHSESWRAVGRWPSVVLSLALTEPVRTRLTYRQLEERLQRVRAVVITLQIVGIMNGVALVFGAPLAVERYGRAGLYYSGDALLGLGVLTSILCVVATRRLDARGWTPIRFAIAYLWPFSGPYAAERVLAFAMADGSPVGAFRALAGNESFARWARPHAYDALAATGAREMPFLGGFGYRVGRRELEEMLGVLPANTSTDSLICPRCGVGFRDDVRVCSDCGEIELIRAAARNPPRPKRHRKR
jgi:hypothetical protein